MDSAPTTNSPQGNLQPDIYAAIVITLTLAVVAVTLRFTARWLVRMPLWLDDWLTLFALVTTIGFNINICFLVKNGTGLHIQAIERDTTQIYHDFFLGLWIAELFYTLALTPAKLAFLAFYWRIFRVSSIKLPIKIMAVTVMCWAISRIIVTICHCIPLQAYWDKSIKGTCNVDDQRFFAGSVTPHLVMDLIILLLPAPYIKNLQISWHQKLCLFAMFLFGGFICFASVIQIITCFKLDTTSPDVTWNFASIALWATVEVNLAVLAVCLPSLRPIYSLIFKRFSKGTQTTRQTNHPSSSWKGRSKLQANIFKGDYSDSTKHLAVTEGEYNKISGEAYVYACNRSTDTSCELDKIALVEMHKTKDGIMAKDGVKTVARGEDASHN